MPFIGSSSAVYRLLTALSRYPRAERAPLGGEMAAVALLAKIAPMHIIIIMATVAGLRHDDTVIHRQFMASVAGYFLMCAIQLEFGTRVVIKIPGLPGSGVVAGIAFFTQSALVYLVIVLLVT